MQRASSDLLSKGAEIRNESPQMLIVLGGWRRARYRYGIVALVSRCEITQSAEGGKGSVDCEVTCNRTLPVAYAGVGTLVVAWLVARIGQDAGWHWGLVLFLVPALVLVWFFYPVIIWPSVVRRGVLKTLDKYLWPTE